MLVSPPAAPAAAIMIPTAWSSVAALPSCM
jgi:hypothetical protein